MQMAKYWRSKRLRYRLIREVKAEKRKDALPRPESSPVPPMREPLKHERAEALS